jgi:REP element-mobilizing transposase RayT
LHFVTTVTEVRGEWFTTEFACREILRVFEHYRAEFGIICLGYVLMPDHLHALLYQETGDSTISTLMQRFKSYTSQRYKP